MTWGAKNTLVNDILDQKREAIFTRLMQNIEAKLK